MKVALINSVCGTGSTGKICVGIGKSLEKNNIDHKIFYACGKSNYQKALHYSNNKYITVQALKSRILGNYGFNSKKATAILISELEKYQPDIIHIHNIHGHDCNLDMLFTYLKQTNKKIIWTFHDCWAFTGYCTYFTMCKCEKWKEKCFSCQQKREYTWFLDRSTSNFDKKQELFSRLDLRIITPSKWLAEVVKESFLKDYPITVINNGIDLSVFKPTESSFRQKYKISQKQFLILGVAFGWDKRKGLDVFLQLHKEMDSDIFRFALIGTDNRIDQSLPKDIISIHRTENQLELAEIYTAADVFVNPTREENYPTVNMEAIACGTPVVTFNTGGSPEILSEITGKVIYSNTSAELKQEIIKIYYQRPYETEDCVNEARKFDQNKKFQEYVEYMLNLDKEKNLL